MSMLNFKSFAATAIVAAGVAASGTASALTLNTSALQANAVLTFSVSAFGSATAAGIKFSGVGNMVKTGDVTIVDPDGFEDIVPRFNLPVTEANVSIGWDLKIKADSGKSIRSVLKLDRGTRTISLANFVVDFRKKVLFADFLAPTGLNEKNQPLYTFVESVPQKISLKGLVLNQSVTISKLVLTPGAQQVLGDTLALSAPLRATLVTQEWGDIAILVTSNLRLPPVSNKPYTAADL